MHGPATDSPSGTLVIRNCNPWLGSHAARPQPWSDAGGPPGSSAYQTVKMNALPSWTPAPSCPSPRAGGTPTCVTEPLGLRTSTERTGEPDPDPFGLSRRTPD